MNDFQDSLKKLLFEAEGASEESPIGAPEKFHIGHHQSHMAKATDAAEMLRMHLEAQAFEFQKLKKAYTDLVQVIQNALGDMGTYGVEDKGFMKGRLKPLASVGQPSPSSTAAALQGAQDFRTRMSQPTDIPTDF